MYAARLRGGAAALSAPLCLLLVCICLLWKITLTRQYTWLNFTDMVNQVLPWFQFQAVEWQHRRVPLWDPFHWAGQSLIGQDQPGVAYPLNWALFLLPLRHGQISQVWLNWYMLVIHYMAALFCFFLCRDLGRSKVASAFGGVAFSFLGYMAATNWPQMLNGAVWAPLALLMFFRVLRARSVLLSGALSGAFLGVSYLSGHHQIPLFMTLTLLGGWIYLFSRQPRRYVHAIPAFAAFVYCLFAFSAVQVLPGFEYWHLALRWVGSANPLSWRDPVPYIVHARYSMNPVSIVGLVIPHLSGYADPFVGFAALTLFIIGARAHWGRAEVRLLVTFAACGLLYSLGAYTVFQGVLYAVLPEVDKARSPAAAICVSQLACAVMASFGLDAVASSGVEILTFMRRAAIGVATLAVFILGFLFVSFAVQPEKTQSFIYFGTACLAAGLVGAALLALCYGGLSVRLSNVLFWTALLFEAGTVTGYTYPHREDGWNVLSQLGAFDDIASFLRGRPDLVRVRADRDAIPFDFGDWYRIDQLDGYCGVTKSVFDIYGEDHAQMLLGETFWVGRRPSRAGQEPVFSSKSGLIVYRNPDAFPRAWVVHRVGVLAASSGIVGELQRPLSGLRDEAFISGVAPALDSCSGDRIKLVSRSPGHVVIDATMGCKGMVVMNDSYFPGWRARVDGRPATLYDVDTVIRGVVADAGTHRVDLRYVPRSVIAGALLLISGVLFLGLLGFLSRRVRAGAAAP